MWNLVVTAFVHACGAYNKKSDIRLSCFIRAVFSQYLFQKLQAYMLAKKSDVAFWISKRWDL